MIPFPLIVILFSLVNSIHCKVPEPQAEELVGAMILPSSYMCFNEHNRLNIEFNFNEHISYMCFDELLWEILSLIKYFDFYIN
jgi:hypothetical protein